MGNDDSLALNANHAASCALYVTIANCAWLGLAFSSQALALYGREGGRGSKPAGQVLRG